MAVERSLPVPRLGVCYYPEHWPEAQWASDALRLAERAGRVRGDAIELELARIEGLEGQGRYDDAIAAIDAYTLPAVSPFKSTSIATDNQTAKSSKG